jgi:hypothetical protein
MTKPNKKRKRGAAQAVYVLKTFTSGCVAIPHIGSKGWLCRDKRHQHAAGQINKVCVVFRARYDPSNGDPTVPKGYLPVHIYFPEDHLSKRRIGVKRQAQLRHQFLIDQETQRRETEAECKRLSKTLEERLKRFDKQLGGWKAPGKKP